MDNSRRNLLLSTLFGAGYVGLRALATGLPAALLLDPRRADATDMCPAGVTPQFVILATSAGGDPINANAPGTYDVSGIYHCPTLPVTSIQLGSKSYKAAAPWAMKNLNPARTSVWHMMTDTPIHPKEPDVLKLMGAISPGEMFPSFLAKNLQACLGTIQAQPISVGASSPSEGLTFNGAALPIIPPLSLKATLANPTGALTNLQKLRDDTLDKVAAIYKAGGTKAQSAFIDSLVLSQTEVRNISQMLLDSLNSITDNSADSQILAAVTLIQMKVAPVVAIHIPMGGDNHHDQDLATEDEETTSGMATLDNLLGLLGSNGLADTTSVISLNVFGRTLGPASTNGRQHNPNHQVSFAIGKPFRGGVYGGVGPLTAKEGGDFGALAMNSKTGVGAASGDIAPVDTLASFGMTVATAVGVDPAVVSKYMDPKYTSAGMGTAKVVNAAIA